VNQSKQASLIFTAAKYSPGLGPERVRSPTFGKGKQANTFAITGNSITNIVSGFTKNEHFPEFPSKMNNFSEKDSEMDSQMSSCCCFLLRLLFVQKTAHARGGCQGASGFVHSSLFAVGGYPFFEAILGTFFSTKKCNFEGKWLPK